MAQFPANFTFTVTFNVQGTSGQTYRSFIEDLRRRLTERSSHNRPILRPPENPPTHWFEVVLQGNTVAINLAIRMDNLYLVGYRRNGAGQWLELARNNSPHVITGSTLLGFDGGYTDLENAAGRGRGSISLGQRGLMDAVDHLANSDVNREQTAQSLIVVIQMICESTRFIYISNHLVTVFNEVSPLPPALMVALENGWGNLSGAVQQADVDPMNRFLLRRNVMEITNIEQAVAVLGIMVECIFRSRALREVPSLHGRPLVEVFAVIINNIDGEDPGDLYGTITFTDGLGSAYIYNRERGNSESIKPRDHASLNGPYRSISAYDSFTINVALMDRDSDASPDDEVSRGQISWNVFDTTNVYDKLLFAEIKGKYGSATVNYAVLRDAVEATVEVTLINGDGEDPADVYGLLTAHNVISESTLFRKESNEHINVRPGNPIPLSRSVVAVPLNSSLVVRAELYDHDGGSSDDEIAKGTATFPAQLFETSEQNINGKYGQIRVKVIWTDY